MNSLSNLKLSEDKWLVKAVCIAGRFGKYAMLALLAVTYIATCLGAFSVARVAVVAMLPVGFLMALYIEVKEALND